MGFLRTPIWRFVLIALLAVSIPLYVLQVTLVPKTGDFGLSIYAVPYTTNADGTRVPVLDVEKESPAWQAGLRAGDTIVTSGDNGGVLFWPLPGDGITVHYERGSQLKSASMVARSAPPVIFGLPEYVRAGVVAFLLIFALLVIVRAWNTEYGPLIATMLALLVVNPAADAVPYFARSGAGELAVIGITWLAFIAGSADSFVAFLLIDRLLDGHSRGVRWITIVLGIDAGVCAALAPFVMAATLAGRCGLVLGQLFQLAYMVVPLAGPVVALPFAYAASRGEDRARLAWLFWGYFPFSVGVLAVNLPNIVPQLVPLYANAELAINIGGRLLEISLPIALFYGLMLRRTVDIGFIVNRAAVYGLISIAVLTIFVTLEYLVGHFFFDSGRVASLALQLGIALIIGVSIRYLHGLLDRFVDRIFFAKRHADEAALRRFAHEAEAFTSAERLLDRTLQTVREHCEARGVAIYLPGPQVAKAERTSSDQFPATVDLDDPLLVALRRWKEPVDTHDVTTVLPDGMGFPMVARGRLSGVLMCLSKRDGTAYAPDERGPLQEVAASVARALDSLSYERTETLETIERSIEALRGTMSTIEDAVTAVKDAVVAKPAPESLA